ncbi:putative O-glycosylation ligase, exosortase A system-associated [Muricoccus aerilatus]|uniref:putative O-glycosylation ligase, exosortase A system-associated n=1 Tax=Muricoccus aerilatus TaxID=452982 RepID=UPI0005C1C035|nr:putative O-glycosylation ligase, exosortase A system-associated [Roseomonas aerilata]
MLRSVYLTLIYIAFVTLGVAAPFVFSLGYVWVDTFTPQNVAYSILPSIPVSLIMALLAIGGYVMMDRRDPPGISLILVLTVLFAGWVTFTTAVLAVSPWSAWTKWNWAVKTILFSAFIPYVFRSRVQIEAFLQIYLFSLAIHVLPTGLKTIINGGGYGMALGVVSGNSGFAEGSTLAAVALMLLPIVLYLRNHTIIVPKHPITNLMYIGLAVATITCAVGTYARTGLIGMLVVGTGLWLRTRHKVTYGLMGAVAGAALVFFTSSAWNERISTINTYQTEGSALGRILVWKWTLDFVAHNPLGGGFNSFEVNEIRFPAADGGLEDDVFRGKAFHSIYFEVLGEHGWPGLALFGALIVTAFLSLQRTSRWAKKTPGMEWLRELAYALQVSLITLLACGSFIGVAFQPMLYYMFALSACLAHHVQRLKKGAADAAKQQRSWRDRLTLPKPAGPALPEPAVAAGGGWRAAPAAKGLAGGPAYKPPVPTRQPGWRNRPATGSATLAAAPALAGPRDAGWRRRAAPARMEGDLPVKG